MKNLSFLILGFLLLSQVDVVFCALPVGMEVLEFESDAVRPGTEEFNQALVEARKFISSKNLQYESRNGKIVFWGIVPSQEIASSMLPPISSNKRENTSSRGFFSSLLSIFFSSDSSSQ